MMINLLTFTFGDVFSILLGALVGLSWGAFIIVKQKKKQIISHIDKTYDQIDEEKRLQIEKHIDNMYKYHVKSRKNKIKLFFGLFSIKRKVNQEKISMTYIHKYTSHPLPISKEIYYLVENVAKVYYPDSEYPLLELNIDEVFVILKKINNEIVILLESLNIPGIQKLKVSTIYDIINVSNRFLKLYRKKGIKALITTLNILIKLQSFVTPVYWIKRGTNFATTSSLSQFLTECLFELVGKEVSVIYAKENNNDGYLDEMV